MYHFVFYTDLVDSMEMREMIGWSQIGFIILILAFNTYIVLYVTVKALKRKYTLWKMKREYEKIIKARN